MSFLLRLIPNFAYLRSSLGIAALICGLTIAVPSPSIAQSQNNCCRYYYGGSITAKLINTQAECALFDSMTLKAQFYKDALVGKDSNGNLTCVPNSSATKDQVKKKEPSIFSPPDISVAIPGMKPLAAVKCPEKGPCEVPWIGQYFVGLQQYGLGAISILSAIMLMIGGLVWLTSAGNAAAVGRAKKIIGGSLSGLLLAFASYLILYFANPKLVDLPSLKITQIEEQVIPLQECANGDCKAADEGIAALTLPVPKNFIKAIVTAGESCNPKLSTDGKGGCGLGQVLPDNRREYCGLPGTPSDCDLMRNNPALDIECVAKVMIAQTKMSGCGHFDDIRKTALCWNAGPGSSKTCAQTTDDYCGRVENYLREKCSANSSENNSTN